MENIFKNAYCAQTHFNVPTTEDIFKIAYGSQNRYFKEVYMDSNKYNEFKLEKELKNDREFCGKMDNDELEINNTEITKYHHQEEISINMNKVVIDPHIQYVSKLKLIVEYDTMELSIEDKYSLLQSTIDMVVGGSSICSLSIDTNIVLCHMIDRNIKESMNKIIIPIVLFDLYKNKRIDIMDLYNHQVMIVIKFHKKINARCYLAYTELKENRPRIRVDMPSKQVFIHDVKQKDTSENKQILTAYLLMKVEY